MTSEDPLLDQADVLMRRHRVFVAGSQADTEPAGNSDGDADGLPVLTDEVDVEPVPAVAEVEALAQARCNQLLADRRAALDGEMETWIDEQLPQLVILAMDGITDHLVSLITHRAREELLRRLDEILMPATSSGSSALSTETPGRVQTPKADSGEQQAVPEDNSERPG